MSYIIESGNDCAIIDPMRESSPYLEYIFNNQLNLRYIMMTHLHADYVAGHFETQKIY